MRICRGVHGSVGSVLTGFFGPNRPCRFLEEENRTEPKMLKNRTEPNRIGSVFDRAGSVCPSVFDRAGFIQGRFGFFLYFNKKYIFLIPNINIKLKNII